MSQGIQLEYRCGRTEKIQYKRFKRAKSLNSQWKALTFDRYFVTAI
jgi:hypothetical protein